MAVSKSLVRSALPTVYRLALEDEAKQRLRGALETFPYDAVEPNVDLAGALVGEYLPEAMRHALVLARRHPHPAGVLVFRNLPLDRVLPATPTNGAPALCKESHVTEGLLLGVAARLGEPVGFEEEKPGVVHDVVPVRGKEQELTNQGSSVHLGFHTELAFLAEPFRWLLLLCLRADHEAAAVTPVADVRQAVRLLDPVTLSELGRKQFRTRAPYVFHEHLPEEKRWSEPHAVLDGARELVTARAALYGNDDEPLTRGENPAAARALGDLDEVLTAVAVPLRLEPGDLAVIANDLVLHGRSPFRARFDGVDRWLQRVSVAASTWQYRHHQRHQVRLLNV